MKELIVLHEQFDAMVESAPHKVAISANHLEMTYQSVQERANQLAYRLMASGIESEDVVGIYIDRSPDMIIAMLAVLKVGAAYLALPPDYPAERLRYMVADSRTKLVLTRTVMENSPVIESVATLSIDEFQLVEPKILPHVSSQQLAYIIYTSGSTGQPKGVGVAHYSAANLVSQKQHYVHFGPDEKILQLAPAAFDASAFEIWGALTNGATLVLASPSYQAIDELPKCLIEYGITTLLLTPALFHVLVDYREEALDGVPQLIVGGDAMSITHAFNYLSRKQKRGQRFLFNNVYGPTEGTTLVSSYPMSSLSVDATKAPLGEPIDNAKMYLLDEMLRPVRPGESGEIYIGGQSVARGYLYQPGLTSQRFLPDPFSTQPGARMFATGDEGILSNNGLIEFVGRLDDQVKVRGHRVELAEVEHAIRSCQDVSSVCVVLHIDNKRHIEQLVAHYAIHADAESIDIEQSIISHIQTLLPAYMHPSRFIRHEQLPLTTSGKVDRRLLMGWEEVNRLEEMPSNEFSSGQADSELTEDEALLAKIWQQVLGPFDAVPEADFFALGGDSILAIQVIAEAEKQGLVIELGTLFRNPTLRGICSGATQTRIDSTQQNESQLINEFDKNSLPVGIETAYPATRLQLGMLFEGLYSDKSIYLDIISRDINLPLDEKVFYDTLQAMARRHPVLRTRFDLSSFSEVMQLVEVQPLLPLAVESYINFADEQLAERHEHVMAELRKPFDPEVAPLMRVHAAMLNERQFRLTYAFHHAILDGWSESVFILELLKLYQANLSGESISLASPAPLSEFVKLEREALGNDHAKQFFSRYSAKEKMNRHQVPDFKKASRILPERTVEQLLNNVSKWGIPLKSMFFAGFYLATAHQLQDIDFVAGMSVNGRPEMEGADLTLGLFLNHVPIKLNLDSVNNWQALARQSFNAEKEILLFRRFPYSEIQAALGGPPFEAAFSYVHFHSRNELLKQGLISVDEDVRDHTSLPIRVELINDLEGEGIFINVTADEKRYGIGFALTLAEQLSEKIEDIAFSPERII
ncbi:linear gramicidin synthetase subunit D [Xenorhabdus mauleonii]|uniref:Amino acid adenylation domain-containing protein n=1 Tax=Xenorhabdus mauleonii TaxID=351675 RepID=A0A1I3T0S6_9GAMM|nr:amino acid adenylation domain-containing protein [Xenorhabdus mauleonii]PHM44687.1 linear gramicidin synthetase subunit D [Xenorhabdus mauleonii]SFJ64270.1 amino acid adenylation domain-containing protein [Xenorhabdus mauleonii]